MESIRATSSTLDVFIIRSWAYVVMWNYKVIKLPLESSVCQLSNMSKIARIGCQMK